MNIIGSNLIVLKEIGSTNEYAYDLLSQSKQIDGTIVLTYFQTNGKGQGKNLWISEKNKNLLLSIILQPDFLDIEKQFYLSMIISLGILNTIRKYTSEEIKIKWPNDIFLAGKKVAGILIKNILSGKKIKNSIIGIGLNINQYQFNELENIATSMAKMENKEFDLKKVLDELIINLNYYYNKLRKNKYVEIKKEYLENLYKLNIQSNFELPAINNTPSKSFSGKITGIDESGRLLVETQGEIKTFMHKEIIFHFKHHPSPPRL